MGVLAFGTAATANTLTVDFGGVYGGELGGTAFGDSSDGVNEAFGEGINISTITIQDDTGTNVYEVTNGLLNFDTAVSGLEMTITGGVAAFNVAVGTTLFEGSFINWSYVNNIFGGPGESFSGSGTGAVNQNIVDLTVSDSDNPFAFGGFSLQSTNGAVLSTDFLMTATGDRTVVPVPAAAWLFGSGLLGLMGVARRKV